MGWLFHFPGVRMVTGTPRRAVRSSSESRLRSGRKYGEQMRIDSRAEATRIWKRSRARVERPEEGDLAIDDQDVAVRAVVEALQRVPGDRLIPVDAATGGAQRFEIILGGVQAADTVDNDAHGDAGARALGEHLQDLVAGASAQEEIDLEMDAAPRGAHRLELGGVDLGAAAEHIELARREK